jgi:GT2 family glycosyltransferase
VTLVVVSWNTVELLRRCLSSVRAAAETGELAIIVVDNDSSDGSASMVQQEFRSVAELIQTGANLGFGRAANLGASRANTPWLAIANADVEVPRDAIQQLLVAAKNDPRLGLLAPRLDLPSGVRQETVARFPTFRFAAMAALGLHLLHPRIAGRMFRAPRWNPEARMDVDWVRGAFFVVRRDAFQEVGGFADDQWMYAEDLDLCWRLHHRGWSVRYVPDVTVTHVGGAAAGNAFGGTTGTLEVVGAYYHWLRTRRGVLQMWLIAAATGIGAAVRVVVYRLGQREGLRRRARVAAEWLKVNVLAASDAKNSRV